MQLIIDSVVRKKRMSNTQMIVSDVGAILIGRNEGDRLRSCVESVLGCTSAVVYVDSGSTDGSRAMAQKAGCDVVELDPQIPFTAARARNEGLARMLQLAPNLRFVQFVDGDCEMVAGWMEKALAFLESNKNFAVVCGRRRERYPARSIYNWLCDIEWDTPIGEAKACGGDALMRVAALEHVGGFRAEMPAGEEPELCVRLRAMGWRVWRLDAEMTLHDAAMIRFSQWWTRYVRSGYAFALGAHLQGAPPERHFVWEARRAWLWGVWLPLACLAGSYVVWPWGLAAWLIYPLQILRQTARNSGQLSHRATLALYQLLGRFAEAWGEIKFMRDRLLRRRAQLIEYK
jgi:GT2 family glycosyltransferase